MSGHEEIIELADRLAEAVEQRFPDFPEVIPTQLEEALGAYREARAISEAVELVHEPSDVAHMLDPLGQLLRERGFAMCGPCGNGRCIDHISVSCECPNCVES